VTELEPLTGAPGLDGEGGAGGARDDFGMASVASATFRWEEPREGDPWNTDSFGHRTALVGRVGPDQVIARIMQRPDRKAFEPEFALIVVMHEGRGGASHRQMMPCYSLNQAREMGEHVLFGFLRRWIKCTSCRRMAWVHYTNEAELRRRGLCFGCDVWLSRIAVRATSPNVVVADGKWMTVAEERPAEHPRQWSGFGGSRFLVKWNDGRQLYTTNLWHGGEVPDHLRELLPDDGTVDHAPQYEPTPGEVAL
jgi:hypothetical protein